MQTLSLNTANTNQVVSIEKLVEILMADNKAKNVTILYAKMDDRASKKTPFGKITKQTIAINHVYENKFENRISDEEVKKEVKESEFYSPQYEYYNDSKCIAKSKKTQAFQLVYTFDRDTQAIETIFTTADFSEQITLEEAKALCTPSGLKKFENNDKPSEKIAKVDTEKQFRWQAINLSNLIGITLNKTNYILEK